MVNNDVITQVIHLEYFNLNNEFYIQHLDHEFISYTLEQYEKNYQTPKSRAIKKQSHLKLIMPKSLLCLRTITSFYYFRF